MTLAKARIVNYDRNCSYIVLAIVVMIVNYNRHLFIVQATSVRLARKLLLGTNTLAYLSGDRVTKQERFIASTTDTFSAFHEKITERSYNRA